jgi:hypothetical protein
MQQAKKSSDPWIANRSDNSPRGPLSCAQDALALLGGPFSEKNVEDNARLAIEELARNFNHKTAANADAPRNRDVIEELEAAVISLSLAAEVLSSLSDVARLVILSHGTGLNDSTLTAEKHPTGRDLTGLFPIEGEQEGRTVVALKSTARSILLSRDLWRSRRPDKGGNTNPYKQIVGDPRFALVQEGLIVFEKYKSGEAKGTIGGKLHSFLMAVFEYATGKDPEDHSKLEHWVRQLPKAYRRMPQIRERLLELENEVDIVQRTPGGPSRAARLGKIFAEKDSLENEHATLWNMFYQIR